jgi:hypothetical protein
VKKISPAIVVLIALLSATVYAFTTAPDNFTRADNTTLGTDWIDPETELGIKSNSATEKNISINAQAVAWWNPSTNTFSANQFSQVTCNTVSGTPPYGSQQCGVGVNMSGASLALFTGYVVFADASSNTWNVQRQDAGISYHPLASGSHTAADGDVLYLQNNAGVITFKINGSTVASPSDSTYGAGQPGINIYSNGSGDDIGLNTWSGGDLGGGGSTFPGAIIGNPHGGGGIMIWWEHLIGVRP